MGTDFEGYGSSCDLSDRRCHEFTSIYMTIPRDRSITGRCSGLKELVRNEESHGVIDIVRYIQ